MQFLIPVICSLLSCALCAVPVTEESRETEESAERVCYGSRNGLSLSVNGTRHYNNIRARYNNCTYVEGNLELTYLDRPDIEYNLDFLSRIRVVTGYVLIVANTVEVIPLTSLELIRGDERFEWKGRGYGLFVALNYGNSSKGLIGTRELQLPALREISHGRVVMKDNRVLCNVDTIDWKSIVPAASKPLVMSPNSYNHNCPPCAPVCSMGNKTSCWGAGEEMCQAENHNIDCDSSCSGRCYKPGILGCCNPNCAAGCVGPFDSDCEMCKYYRYGWRCLFTCPEGTYRWAGRCLDLL